MAPRLGISQDDKTFHIGGVRPYTHAPRTSCAILGMMAGLNHIGRKYFFTNSTFQNWECTCRVTPAAYRKRLGIESMTGS
jgi:hypothetical protein